MSTLYVQYADATEAVVISCFSCPQDPAAYPNQGTLSTADPKWATYYNNIPELMRSSTPAPTSD